MKEQGTPCYSTASKSAIPSVQKCAGIAKGLMFENFDDMARNIPFFETFARAYTSIHRDSNTKTTLIPKVEIIVYN